jgi:hypothetical protein
MFGANVRAVDRGDTLSIVMIRVEHRLRVVMALLVLGIAGILAGTVSGPAIQYVTGPEFTIAAAVEGEACGSHLSWEMDSRTIPAGTQATILNDSVYWQIPVIIERQQSDGDWNVVAESPVLRGGESWDHTFWRSGTYRVVSGDETQRLAGLERTISVE